MLDHLSYSEFSTALLCLRKYQYLYVDKIKLPELDKPADLAFGSAIHAGVNAYLEGHNGTSVFNIFWESIREKDMLYSRFNWEELKNLGEVFLSKFTKRYLRDFKPVHMEKRLYSEYRGIKLEGTPDFFGLYKDEKVVFDWKTSAYPYYKERGLTSLQLALYTYLGIRELGFTPQKLGYLVFVKATGSVQNPILVDFDEKVLYDKLDSMVDYYEKLDKAKTYPKNPNQCIVGSNYCPFIDLCWNKKVKENQ